MKQIGGYFTIESPLPEENHFLEGLCPKEGELKYLMSGRCANCLALKDNGINDKKKVAYVPIYTCETVIAPFVKEGYSLIFYDFKKDMTPIFDPAVLDRISIISICGYYGFSRYDRSFVDECKRRGITVIEDTTHSIFSEDGIYPGCDYVVGSLRKWIGVPAGGFAIKMKGKFLISPEAIHAEHIKMRTDGLKKLTRLASEPLTEEVMEKKAAASTLLWDSELLLRKIFDSQESDELSVNIIKHFDFDELKRRRRENYAYLLSHCPESDKFKVVFDELDEKTVPSHFTLYVNDRDSFKAFMEERGIHATTYWPVGPEVDLRGHDDAAYIYDHVISLSCDQRNTVEDMQYICDALSEFIG